MSHDPSLTPEGVTLRSLGRGAVGRRVALHDRAVSHERGDATHQDRQGSQRALEGADRHPARFGQQRARRRRRRREQPQRDDARQRRPVAGPLRGAADRPAGDGRHEARRDDHADRQHPAVHPRPAARADAQRTRPVDLELPRHPGLPAAGSARGLHDEGLRPRQGRLGAGRHAPHRADAGQAAAVGDALRPAVRRAGALQASRRPTSRPRITASRRPTSDRCRDRRASHVLSGHAAL